MSNLVKEVAVVEELVLTGTTTIDMYGSIEEPLFMAKDVAIILGNNPELVGQMTSKIDQDELTIVQSRSGGQMRSRQALTEDGLYECFMLSRKPEAKEFKKVVKQLLKGLRTGKVKLQLPDFNNPIIAARAWADEYEAKQIAQTRLKEKAFALAMAAPKVDFYDGITQSDDTIDIGTVSKVLNMGVGRNTLFKILREEGVLMTSNQPYQQFVDRGYFRLVESKFNKPDGTPHVGIKTVVFQKGVEFIKKKLEARSY